MISRRLHPGLATLLLGMGGLLFNVSMTHWDSQPAPSHDHAHLSVSEPVVQLGEITPGTLMQVPFLVKNVGSRRLVIRRLNEQCHCSETAVSPIIIPPGGSSNVWLTLDYRAATRNVPISGVFSCNDPTTPRFQLTVLARVPQGDHPPHAVD